MRRPLSIGVVVLVLSACRTAPDMQPDFRPTATVKEIMDSIVDPAADAVWESVATISSQSGIEERQPRTDQEWAAVRRHAVALLEATNLLLMDRSVARADDKPSAGEELPAAEIEARINGDRAAWTAMVHGLHDAVQPALRAIDARSPSALLEEGEHIDEACENCHRKYWYAVEPPSVP